MYVNLLIQVIKPGLNINLEGTGTNGVLSYHSVSRTSYMFIIVNNLICKVDTYIYCDESSEKHVGLMVI